MAAMAFDNGEDTKFHVIELNVGGVFYTTARATLIKEPGSLLSQWFSGPISAGPFRDSKGKFFLTEMEFYSGTSLDYLRDQKLVLPENFHERRRLRHEAEYFNLAGLGYRGTFAFGRDGLADVKFRKLTRILVSGRVNLCREVFGETLNESRDPDRGTDYRYSARFFLKHNFLEQAFDNLQEAGFRCVAGAGSGTSCGGVGEPMKPGMDSEENRWNHYNEFVFSRP
ncbi:hypothetical protein CEXT_172851 [Caerostris extrusa]|uniref:Uncharacterized protein n=1 Tax=Caerostris extrusa TaxID=172846 RepID=A0AAV4NHS9_CAEEX|nr:hypothetical protein CEXT_172851 [Caerostris extrusa]